jgi:hypothetical protein
LIGYNCPQALAPQQCIPGNGNEPFVVHTALGWSIIGTFSDQDPDDNFGVTHKMVTKSVPDKTSPDDLQTVQVEVKYECRAPLKEVSGSAILGVLESDFIERKGQGDATMSQEDIALLKIVSESIHQQEDGYNAMP